MPIPFPQYAKIKDNYCCCYLGNAPEYVIALKFLKPQIEQQLPGLKFWISCRSEFEYLLDGEEFIPVDKLDQHKDRFAYIREMRNDYTKHSVLELMNQSELKIEPIVRKKSLNKCLKVCLICPEGIEPTKSLDETTVKNLANKVIGLGFTPIVVGSDVHKLLNFIKLRPTGEDKLKYIESAGWIIGVENEYLFLGASQDTTKITLLESGIGTSLFSKLFPHAEIQSV